MNPTNKSLQILTEVFTEHIDYKIRRPKSFRINSKNISKLKMKKEDLSINIFDDKYCAIYITLMNPIGTILSISHSFKETFGYESKAIVG